VSSLILCDDWDTESNDEANEPSDGVNEDLLVSGKKFISSYKMKSSKSIKRNNLKSNNK